MTVIVSNNKVKSLEPRVCGSYVAKSEVKHLAAGDYGSNNVDQYPGICDSHMAKQVTK